MPVISPSTQSYQVVMLQSSAMATLWQTQLSDRLALVDLLDVIVDDPAAVEAVICRRQSESMDLLIVAESLLSEQSIKVIGTLALPVIVLQDTLNESMVDCAALGESVSYIPVTPALDDVLVYAIPAAIRHYELFQKANALDAHKTTLLSALKHRIRPSQFAESLVLSQLRDGHYGELTPRQQSMITELLKSNESTLLLLDNLAYLHHAPWMDTSADASETLDINACIRFLTTTRYDDVSQAEPPRMSLMLDEHLPRYEGQCAMVQQALSNVIKNAMRYTLPHGHIQVYTALNEAGTRYQITVINDGPNIPEDVIQNLSDPSQNPTMDYRFKGGHLGLFSTLKIMRACEGDLHVTVPASGGCSVVLTLPVP